MPARVLNISAAIICCLERPCLFKSLEHWVVTTDFDSAGSDQQRNRGKPLAKVVGPVPKG
jgi:hypothetical protein